MKTLIIGKGEIGTGLYDVLQKSHEVYIRDIEYMKIEGVEVLNICYPYSDRFVENTKKYIAEYKPRITVIHSTVKPGTTRLCGEYVVHSPIHGKHPNLAQGILTFMKYVGGTNIYAVAEADNFLHQAGIKTEVVSCPEASELSKILCTTQYGWNIILMKEIARICEEYQVPFTEVYTRWNYWYNKGYAELDNHFFGRPVLTPVDGEIGGHCVINNCDLLPDFITDTIKARNRLYRKEKNENRKKHKNLAKAKVGNPRL